MNLVKIEINIGTVRLRAVTGRTTMCLRSHCLETKQPSQKWQDQQADETPITDKLKRRNTFKNHLLEFQLQVYLQVISYLIKSHHQIFQGIVLSILGGKN